MRHSLRTLAAAAAAAVIAVTGTATAGALERSTTPPDYYPDYYTTVTGPQIVSPYGNVAHCWTYKEVTYHGCFQQTPSGEWVELQAIPQLGAVYPVWEDPAALAAMIPPQLVQLIATAVPSLAPALLPQ